MDRRITKVNITSFIEYALILCTIALSNTIWTLPDYALINPNLCFYVWFGLVFIWVAIQINKHHVILKISDCNVLIIEVVLALLYSITHIRYLIVAWRNVFIPIFAYAIITIIANKTNCLSRIINEFVSFMTVLGVVSLIFYYFVNYTSILSPTGYINIDWAWHKSIPKYWDLYYHTLPNAALGGIFSRNTAIFPEGPMFCYPLCLALMLGEYYTQRMTLFKRTILILSILSTFSTTGYLFLILVYVLKYINQNNKKTNYKIITIPIIFGIAIIVVSEIIENKIGTSSYAVRLDHTLVCGEAFIKSYGIGYGLGNSNAIYTLMSRKRGISCGLPFLFALGGIVLVIMYIYPIIKTISKDKQKKEILFCALIFTYLIFVTACSYAIVTWFVFSIICFGIKDKDRKMIPYDGIMHSY